MLTIVIPTLNAGETLPDLLGDIATAENALVSSVVVADGGSGDRTGEIASLSSAVVVASSPGRGKQLVAGAAAAHGEWLLFLHADSRLAPGWDRSVRAFAEDPANALSAGVFRFRLDDDGPAARRLERMVSWRNRILGLPYGDQGLLISRAFYDSLGGYRPLPLMEDVDMVRRIGRRRLTLLDTALVTSARRYQREGYLLRPARNLLCLALYYAGLPPGLIERIYR